MKFTFRDGEAGTEVLLSGRLTFAENDTFRRIVEHFGGFRGERVVFDLSGVEFIDSAGLGMLLVAREMAGRHDMEMTLRGAAGEVGRMLDIARFGDFFAIAP